MDEQKPGFDWKRSLITVAIVLVTAGVVGGTVWYIMDQNAKSIADSSAKSEEALQKQIDELNTKIASSNSQATTNSNTPASTTKTYTDSDSSVSFQYPGTNSVIDVTSKYIGADPNNYPWYDRSDLVKKYLTLDEAGNISVKILKTTDASEVLGSFGGTSTSVSQATTGPYKSYSATGYGNGLGSKLIVSYIIGPTYSVAVQGSDSSYSDTIKSIINSVKFN